MKYVVHADGDAFFASCEIARRPDLKGKPVIVGEEKGIACAFSKEAKRLGIYRGMPVFKIRQQFPEVIVLSSHFDLYESYHRSLVSILRGYLPVVESYSIDECFAETEDMNPTLVENYIRKIKEKVQSSLGVTFSFGVSSTKTLAKIASKKEKPDGCVFLINKEGIAETLRDTPIGAVWGIGRQTTASMMGQNILTAKDFIETPLAIIKEKFGVNVVETWHELHGVKVFEVSQIHDPQKTIQSTRSFSASANKDFLFSELSRNVEVACEQIRTMGVYTNMVHVFYRQANGSKSRVSTEVLLPSYTENPKVITSALKGIIGRIYTKDLRYKSTGVTFLNLRRYEDIPVDLFGSQTNEKVEESYLKAVDSLNRKFGDWSIMLGSSLMSVNKRRGEFILRNKKDSYEYGLPLPFMGEVY